MATLRQQENTSHLEVKMPFFKWTFIGTLCAALVIAAGFSLTVGTAELSFRRILLMVGDRLPLLAACIRRDWLPADELIIFEIRMPRVVLAALVGGALACAGVVFQGLFRNPMADPYVIGISAGAGLGATLAFTLHLQGSLFGLSPVPLLAFAGSLVTAFIVYNLARVGKRAPTTMLLLSGIAVGTFMSAVNSLLMVFNREELHQVTFWLMGGFSSRSWVHVWSVLIYMLAGFGCIMLFSRDLNIMLLGEEEARQLGVDTDRVQRILVAAASLLTAAAVSVSGIIGFVGLIIPHVVRIIIGPDHRFLLPASCLMGALFLLAADTLARTVLSPIELPVGIITALAGAPFFLYLLHKNKKMVI